MQPALFLDRDGVINVERHYLHDIADVEFVPGIFDLCRYWQGRQYALFIITNQAGIARGFYGESQFHTLMEWMTGRFAAEGVQIRQTYHCSHHPDFTGPCECRKPAPGMFLRAQREHAIGMSRSINVGDKASDMAAGMGAGVGHNFLLRDGRHAADEGCGFTVVGNLDEICEQMQLNSDVGACHAPKTLGEYEYQ